MSSTTKSIDNIKKDLDRISGLTGIVSEQIENLEIYVHGLVENILKYHSEASIFNFYGIPTDSDNNGGKVK